MASTPTIFALMACGSISSNLCAHGRSVATASLPFLTRDATTQSPVTRPVASPPAIPKLMMPEAPPLDLPAERCTEFHLMTGNRPPGTARDVGLKRERGDGDDARLSRHPFARLLETLIPQVVATVNMTSWRYPLRHEAHSCAQNGYR